MCMVWWLVNLLVELITVILNNVLVHVQLHWLVTLQQHRQLLVCILVTVDLKV